MTLFLFTKHFLSKETFMTHRDTHEHENNKVFSYQRTCAKKGYNSFGKAFLSKKRFVLKENNISLVKLSFFMISDLVFRISIHILLAARFRG